MQLASKPQQLARSIRSKIADIASTDVAIGSILAFGLAGFFVALVNWVGDFYLIMPGLWP